MKLTNVEKKENNQVELSITVSKEEFEDACQRSYRKNVGHIHLQGFRKGKAPRKMIERMYGAEVFYEDAMDFSFADAYPKALEESGLDPIDRPSVSDLNVSDEGEFTFKVTVQLKPDVEIKEYKGLTAPKEKVEVTEEQVNEELDRLLTRNASMVSVERAVQNGDTILLDFDGSVDGVPFDGGKAEDFSLQVGSGSFIPGFEEQIVGQEIGAMFDVTVTFPEEYHEKSLAGKPAVFKCKVNDVKETQKPELDDEFIKDISTDFETVEEYKADLKKKIEDSKKAQADSAFDEAIMDKLLENMEVTVPQVMVESQLDNVVQDFGYRIAMQGMDLDSYLKMQGMEMSSFRRLFEHQAARQVKIRLALEKIAELEGFTVSDEDLEAEFKTLAEQNNLEVERVKQLIEAKNLRADLIVQKASDLVRENAVATEPEAQEEKEKKTPAKKATAKKAEPKAKKTDGEEKKPAAKKSTKKSDKAE